MTVFTAAAVLSGNSAYFHFTRGRWQACPRGESAGRGILGAGAENIPLSSPTLDQHLQKTIFATLFLLKSEEISDWAGSYLTSWRTVLLQETKNQIESFPFSSILQRFASQRNLHNERDLMWFHCNPKLSFQFFGFRLYYFWSTCCHGSCWKLFNLCCQQLIPLFKSSSKYNHNALYFAVLYHLHLN